jgi:hypothetical protein
LGVHFSTHQQAELFQLLGIEEVRLVDEEDDAPTAFVLFGGQQILGLGVP